ncbi:hypothetical protein Adt_38639 [Abeliophyllum distichum]|uniref:Uncharacterized protein n=1 Tax=Abeliophyllum distichum TaxID=126358 RepID=A0ABD1Q2U7_9LAMI
MAAKSTYSLVPPILASIYRGLTETSNCMAGHDIRSIKYVFSGHFLYAWATTYFLRGVYSNIDKSIGRLIIRRYAGTLNDLQPWEVDMFDCLLNAKRALDIPDDGGPKRLKYMFPSTRNVPSSKRVEKIPRTILVLEDSNSGDQASRGLEATLVLEDSSSEDQNNENLDIIDVLDGIDSLNGSKDLPCDYPSHISGGILASKLADINDGGEVNSGTSVVKIPENEQEAHVTPSS